jgi:hypothetical protein
MFSDIVTQFQEKMSESMILQDEFKDESIVDTNSISSD